MQLVRTLALAVVAPSLLAAQQLPTAPLKPANATFSAGFKNVHSMHELSDGRVLMSDAMMGIFGVGNFASGKFTPISNVSAGPMIALAGDSSVMWGLTSTWIFLDGANPIGMLTKDNPVVAAVQWIDGADSMAHVLTTHNSPPGHGDSSDVLRISRITAEADTITRLWMPPRAIPGSSRPVYTVYERALMTIDGWIAVLRTAPYRVDWRSPDGHWVLGPPIPAPVVKMDGREKMAFMALHASGGTPKSPETITNWPDEIAPWTINWPPIASPDGKLLNHRTPTADFPGTRYDVINRHGELERQVTMAANETILGFGARSVYVVVTDKDGMQSVQRHPWP